MLQIRDKKVGHLPEVRKRHRPGRRGGVKYSTTIALDNWSLRPGLSVLDEPVLGPSAATAHHRKRWVHRAKWMFPPWTSNTCHGPLAACTPLLRTPCPVALIDMGFDLFPGSILPKGTQLPDACTLVSRNGQGEAVCSSCGLLRAGCPCKCGASWCWRWREGRLPSGLYAYSCPRPTSIRTGLPLSITPNYNIGREKKK